MSEHIKAVKPQRLKMQELAIACGMTLSDGSPVVVGGEKCPQTPKIIERLKTLGWKVRRMTSAEKSDASDDYGFTGRHFSDLRKLPPAIVAILESSSGYSDCDGPMSVERWILLEM